MPQQALQAILADWLAWALGATNVKQALLADRTGVAKSTISKISTGKQLPEDEMVGRLAEALGIRPPRIAWLDRPSNPGSTWPAPDPAGELGMKIGRAVARAIQETIEKNELWYPGDGLRDLIAALYTLASDFTARGIDTEDIHAAISYLKQRQRPGASDGGRP